MLNSPEVLAKLRASATPNPYPKDWSPVLDAIMEHLGVSMCWCSLRTHKANRGASGVSMFYEDRTIFISRRAERHYLPEWHEIAHCIVGRDRLDEPNWGLCGTTTQSDQSEFDTQAVQFYLMRDHYHGRRAAQAHRSFSCPDVGAAIARGEQVFAEKMQDFAMKPI